MLARSQALQAACPGEKSLNVECHTGDLKQQIGLNQLQLTRRQTAQAPHRIEKRRITSNSHKTLGEWNRAGGTHALSQNATPGAAQIDGYTTQGIVSSEQVVLHNWISVVDPGTTLQVPRMVGIPAATPAKVVASTLTWTMGTPLQAIVLAVTT